MKRKKASSTERVRRHRAKMRAKGFKMKTMWVGMEKIGTEKIHRKSKMLHTTKGTWLKKPPKRKSTFGGL